MRNLSAVVLGLVSLLACGGNSEFTTAPGSAAGAAGTGGMGGGESVLPIAQLPDELAQALCQAEHACNPFFFGIGFKTRDCKASISEQFKEASFTQIQVAIDANTVKYDSAKAVECISAVGSGSCGVLDNQLPAVCRAALVGTVATGGDCDIDAQCAGLSRCQIMGSTCPGTCQARASAGIACTKDADCALGLTCSTATSHCTAPAVEDEPCQGGSAAQCAAGLLCVGNDDSQMRAGSCKSLGSALGKQAGDPCNLPQDPWCADDLSCVIEAISPASHKCHVTAPVGGKCGLSLPGECPAGQYCPLDFADLAQGRLSANCQDLPTEGEPCAPQFLFSRCTGELVCDETTAKLTPTCVKRHTLGQSCSADDLCHSQHCVDQACVPESTCAK